MYYYPSKGQSGFSNLIAALTTANRAFSRNLKWKRFPEQEGKAWAFTLTVDDVKKPGGRISPTGRRIGAACWHAHRDFLMALFKSDPESRVKTAKAYYKKMEGFKRDFPATGNGNMGTQHRPFSYKRACECQEATS